MSNNCEKTRQFIDIPSIASRAEATLLSAILESYEQFFNGQRNSLSMNLGRKYKNNHTIRSFRNATITKITANQLIFPSSCQIHLRIAFYSIFSRFVKSGAFLWFHNAREALLINFKFSPPTVFFSTSAERQIQNYFTNQFDLSEFRCLYLKLFSFYAHKCLF